ncbi:MAG: TnpV protein [Candidatus Pristimantibacillus sp.]
MNRIAVMTAKHWIQHRPLMYSEMKKSGTLLTTLVNVQQTAEAELDLVKQQLIEKHPIAAGVTVEQKMQHYFWIDRTAWELVRESFLFQNEEGMPCLGT